MVHLVQLLLRHKVKELASIMPTDLSGTVRIGKACRQLQGKLATPLLLRGMDPTALPMRLSCD
jgi:hypothetical protein